MNNAFLIRNQLGHWWGRGKRWVDGRELARVAQWTHKDEVANTLFELSSQDFGLRGEIIEVTLVDGKLPPLDVSAIPLPDESDNKELDLENQVNAHTEANTVVLNRES